MSTFSTTLTIDGKEVAEDSAETWQYTAKILREIDKIFQDNDPAVPSAIRQSYNDLRSQVLKLAGEVGLVAHDIEIFGSLERAMAEREWRLSKQSKRKR